MSEKLRAKYQAILDPAGILKVHDVTTCNHNPHPFMLGPKHIGFCSDNYGGKLGDSCTNDPRFPTCSSRGCQLSYQQHTSDHVCFLQAKKNCTLKEVEVELLLLKDHCEADGVDGFGFIPSDFEIEGMASHKEVKHDGDSGS